MCPEVGRYKPSMGLSPQPKHHLGAHPFLELGEGIDIGPGQ